MVFDSPDLWLRDKAAAPGIVPSLNGLRALSIATVFLSHSVSDKIFPGGFGVRVFFIISGFLITRLLFLEYRTTGSISITRFYLRRFLRLYPVIIVYTFVITFACILLYPDGVNVIEPLSALLYFANFYYAHLSVSGHPYGTMPFAIFWSLSVEEHFYLLFPFLFVLMRANPERLASLACIAIATCLMLRTTVALIYPDLLNSKVFYYETQYQMDSISCGVLVALLCEFPLGRKILPWLSTPLVLILAIALILAGFIFRDTFFRETLRYSAMNLGIAILIFTIIFTNRFELAKKILNAPYMDLIGRMSYSIYVWHFGACYFFKQSDEPRWTEFLPVLAITTALSFASYFLIERPIQSLRRQVVSTA